MKSRTSWKEKLDRASRPHVVAAPERWMKGEKGKTMLIPSAWEIDAYLREIPAGQTVAVSQIRQHFAAQYKADITCPLTTGIFLRMIAENAEEERRASAVAHVNSDQKDTNSKRAGGRQDITPYWRVRDDKGQLPPKLKFVLDSHHQLLPVE